VKDLDVHTEKTPAAGFGSAALRDFLTSVTGLGADLPGTVTTGCGRQRQMAMTSIIPERITCRDCRRYVAGQLRQEIASAESLLSLPESSDWHLPAGKRKLITREAEDNRALLARYEKLASRPREQEE
jgi:hypothetical protein